MGIGLYSPSSQPLSKVLKPAPLQPSRYWLHCHFLLSYVSSPLISIYYNCIVQSIEHFIIQRLDFYCLFYPQVAPIWKRPSHNGGCHQASQFPEFWDSRPSITNRGVASASGSNKLILRSQTFIEIYLT